MLASGERSRDGKTFFARRIIAFLPETRQRRFRAALRKCDFHDDRALYVMFAGNWSSGSTLLFCTSFGTPPGNRWEHLLGAKMEVNATFVKSGKYRRHGHQWQLVTWETALPSRLEVWLPADFQQQIEAAKRSDHRFGQYSAALDKVRAVIQHQPMEKAELERMLSALNVPGDFDVAPITWRPDYDQLSGRARGIYLFRDEYIFDLEKAVVVEAPQLGNATYLFAKPRNMDSFLGRLHPGVER